jgi:hypothetical protein
MGRAHQPSFKPVSLLMPTGETVSVGQAGEKAPEILPPDEGPLLVPLEGAGRRAAAPIAERHADQQR